MAFFILKVDLEMFVSDKHVPCKLYEWSDKPSKYRVHLCDIFIFAVMLSYREPFDVCVCLRRTNSS